VVLGWIDPDYFAGGSLKLHPELARQAVEEKIAKPMGLTVEQAALGIHRVINAQMVEGIRLVSVRRGYDPRAFALVPLGGGGPLHAIPLARDLSITRIVVPRFPGVLSAIGLLAAPIEHEMAAAFGTPLTEATVADLRAVLEALDAQCRALMQREGVDDATVRHFADVCYVGQSYHLEIGFDLTATDPLGRLVADFRAAHDRVYGHSTDAPARFVNLRTVHRAEAERIAAEAAPKPVGAAGKGTRRILVADGATVEAAIFDRDGLAPGDRFDGPAIVEQTDTTTLVEPGWRAEVHASGSLILTPI
jgi:N-methylhydantoinase A